MVELTREQQAALEWARNNFGQGYPKELAMLVAELQRENATLRQQYADGLAAWKANNAYFSRRADAGDALLREALPSVIYASGHECELYARITAHLKERS